MISKIVKKEIYYGILSKSFFAFFLLFSSIVLFAFYTSDFFSETWYPNGTYVIMGFVFSTFSAAYGGYLASIIFGWEFENNTIRSLVVYASRRSVFWGKVFGALIIMAIQFALSIFIVMIIGTARGLDTLYFLHIFIQIFLAIYIFSLGAFTLSLMTAITFRKVAYSVITGVVYGLLSIMGFFILSNYYTPGITYLHIDYSYAWSPVHNIPYVIFAVIEWGIIPVWLAVYPIVWILPLLITGEAYFRRCEL